jgi:hypothetical protein
MRNIVTRGLIGGIVVSGFSRTLIVVLTAGSPLLAAGGGTPDPNGIQSFGAIGLARLQSATLSVVAVGGGTPDPSGLCRVHLGFRDAAGQLFRDASGMDIASEFLLTPGRAVHLDLREADAFRGRTGQRVTIRGEARRVNSSSSSSACEPLVATLEIVDSATSNTALLYASHGDSGGPLLFGMVGLGRLQTGRLNLVAIGGGTPDPSTVGGGTPDPGALGGGSPDPSTLPPCAVEVSFVNDVGDPYRNASGVPITVTGTLTLDRAVSVDLKTADAFRGVSGPRVSFRPVVRILTATSCQRPVLSLEVFDTTSGRSALLY